MAWLDDYFRAWAFKVAGVLQPKRATVNFTGVVATDDEPNDTLTLAVSGGGAAPTGTGFRHVTSGVEDAASKLVVNADVDGAAAIAVSKLAPGTNGYVLTTTGGVAVWAAPGGGGSPGGSTGEVQTNGGGSFAGATNVIAGANYVSIGASPAGAGNVRLPSAATIQAGSFVFLDTGDGQCRFGNGGAPAGYVFHDGGNFGWYAGAYRFYSNTTGFAFFSSGDFGGGSDVIFVANCSAAPTTSPTGGGILYAEGGAGKWRGSSGTVTTFAPADPHCPTCGRDFAIEHRNAEHDEHLSLCLPCLVDALRDAGVDAKKFLISEKRGATKAAWDASHAAAKARDAAAEAERLAAARPRKGAADAR